jgi:hypothetical protein
MLTKHRPIFFISVVLIVLFYFTMSDKIPVPAPPQQDFHFKYTVLKGYFKQSEDSTDDSTFDFVCLYRQLHGVY